MRSIASTLFVVLAVAAGCGRPPAKPGTAAAAVDPKWAEDVGDLPFVVGLDAGGKAVSASGRPAMYYFTTTWCGYCKVLAQTGFKDKDVVAKVTAGFTPILLDGDDPANAQLAGQFRVEGFPTVVFTDQSGAARETVVGADVGKLKAALARVAQ